MIGRAIVLFTLLVGLLWLPPLLAGTPVERVGIFDLRKIGEVILGPEGAGRGGGAIQRIEGTGRELNKRGQPRQPAKEEQGQGAQSEEAVKKEIQRLVQELEKRGLSADRRKKLEEELKQQRTSLASVRNAAQRESRDAKAAENLRRRAIEALTGFAKEKGYIALVEKGFWDANSHKNVFLFAGGAKDVTEEAVEWLRARPQSAEKQKRPGGGQRRKP